MQWLASGQKAAIRTAFRQMDDAANVRKQYHGHHGRDKDRGRVGGDADQAVNRLGPSLTVLRVNVDDGGGGGKHR